MHSAVINFTTEEKTKQEAQQLAKKLGISLSTVLNNYLKQFVRTKIVVFSAEEPSEYLLESLQKSEKQLKSGNTSPTFETAKAAIDWLHKKSA